MISVCIIKLIHLALVIVIFLSVFIPNCKMKELAITLLIFLLLKYLFGDGKCGLTELEYLMLGEKQHKQGFIYRLVKPIVTVPEKYFNGGLLLVHIGWIAILAYQIYKYKCSFDLI